MFLKRTVDVGSVYFHFGLDVETNGIASVGESVEGLCSYADICGSLIFSMLLYAEMKLPRYFVVS